MNFNSVFPASMVLETPRMKLRIMQPEDLQAYSSLALHPDTFKYFTKDLSDKDELKNWVAEAVEARQQQIRVPFTVIESDTGLVAGSTSYGNISFFDRRLEIGWSWLAPQFQGTGVNRHAKFALLSYAFEFLKFERVEVKTDVLNLRARAALRKIGMTEEGVLRSHMQMHSNRRRDTIYYSILKAEWPAIREGIFGDI